MNLLVTNTRNAQAYAIIRALRPHAQKIVATMEGENRLAARLSHAANTRLINKRYYAPSPERDWRAGHVQKENSEAEEKYIHAILEICEKENIDTIFPSFDPHVYVFSKNKERFRKAGVLIPIPDYETVTLSLDKYRTIKAAEAVGFPCPKTYLPETEDAARRIGLQLGFPLVIKPRFTAGGRGTAVVRDVSELLAKVGHIIGAHGMPLIQEYIPGNRQENVHLVIDKEGEPSFIYEKQFHRVFCGASFTVYRESVPPSPYALLCGRFLHSLGWWGAGLVELKIDQRDGMPKLMEVNPRFGSGILDSVSVGLNGPLMCLLAATGEKIEPSKDYYPAAIYLHPVEDSLIFGLQLLNLLVYRFSFDAQTKTSISSPNAPTNFSDLIKPYRYACFSRNKKMLDPMMKLVFEDPVVAIILWFQHFVSVLSAALGLGRLLCEKVYPSSPAEATPSAK